jgi:choline dehydrogenase-like flavoprotein
VENLYVVNSSFIVSDTAVNSILTIVAKPMRVGDNLAKVRRCSHSGCEPIIGNRG